MGKKWLSDGIGLFIFFAVVHEIYSFNPNPLQFPNWGCADLTQTYDIFLQTTLLSRYQDDQPKYFDRFTNFITNVTVNPHPVDFKPQTPNFLDL